MKVYGSKKWKAVHGQNRCHICGETYDTTSQMRKRARREGKREIERQRADDVRELVQGRYTG